jgi:hypothetical protein
MKKSLYTLLAVFVVSLTLAFTGSGKALAHCDGLDGPVIVDAKKALESGDVDLILIWVQKKDEAEIRKVFQKALAVRKLNPEAKELADTYFFETLVRIHRAGEGAPYTGLKPAGRDLGPAVPAADKTVADGQLVPLYKLLANTMHDGLHEKFEQVMKKKNFKKDDLEAGRGYVEAYVIFLHYVERLYDAAKKAAAHGHAPEHTEGEAHKH